MSRKYVIAFVVETPEQRQFLLDQSKNNLPKNTMSTLHIIESSHPKERWMEMGKQMGKDFYEAEKSR